MYVNYLDLISTFQAKLQPSQDITVFYDAPDNLGKIMEKYAEFIYTTTKQPLRKYPVKSGEVIIKDKTKV